MKHYPVENVYLYISRHFRLVPIQNSSALWDNCLVYSTSLISNIYLGSNKCSVDNNFTFLAWIATILVQTVCVKHYLVDNNLHFWHECCFHLFYCLEHCLCENYAVENVYLYTSRHFRMVPILSRFKQVFCWCFHLFFCLVHITYISRVNVLFPSVLQCFCEITVLSTVPL